MNRIRKNNTPKQSRTNHEAGKPVPCDGLNSLCICKGKCKKINQRNKSLPVSFHEVIYTVLQTGVISMQASCGIVCFALCSFGKYAVALLRRYTSALPLDILPGGCLMHIRPFGRCISKPVFTASFFCFQACGFINSSRCSRFYRHVEKKIQADKKNLKNVYLFNYSPYICPLF